MKVNCYSQIKLFETLYKKNHIAKNAKIIFISSRAGSIKLRGTLKHHKAGGNLIYRISKSSLNAAVRNIAFDLRQSHSRGDRPCGKDHLAYNYADRRRHGIP